MEDGQFITEDQLHGQDVDIPLSVFTPVHQPSLSQETFPVDHQVREQCTQVNSNHSLTVTQLNNKAVWLKEPWKIPWSQSFTQREVLTLLLSNLIKYITFSL